MNYRNTRNYENLEKAIYAGVGEYGIPEIEPAHIDVGDCEFIAFSQAARRALAKRGVDWKTGKKLKK